MFTIYDYLWIFVTMSAIYDNFWQFLHILANLANLDSFDNFWQFWTTTNKKTILKTCDIWDTDYNSDNWEPEFMTIFVTWHARVTLDSIRNSCDVFVSVFVFVFVSSVFSDLFWAKYLPHNMLWLASCSRGGWLAALALYQATVKRNILSFYPGATTTALHHFATLSLSLQKQSFKENKIFETAGIP